MIRGGIGGGNTKTGLIYEAKVDLTTFLNDQKGYVVSLAGVAFTLINFAFTVLVVLVYPEIHILKQNMENII